LATGSATWLLLYHVSVQPLAERLLSHLRRDDLLHPGDRIGVAVSGGIDSVALLRLLTELRQELGIVLSVVHFNHKLRGAESDADQDFVAALAREHALEFHVASGDVAQHAAEEHGGIEAAARELRYGFFQQLLEAPTPDKEHTQVDKILTGHTLDDQAETVLMRLIRGTGLRGLGGIYPRVVVEGDEGESHGEIIRPLLATRRRELQQYLEEINQPWREDPTNADSKFTRNRVRKLVLPMLEREFNPTVVENFSELAEIARDEEDYWDNEVSGWLGTVVQWSEPKWTRDVQDISFVQIEGVDGGPGPGVPMDFSLRSRIENAPWLVMNASLSRPWLLTEPKAVQRRVLKAIGQEAGIPLEFKHIEEMLRFAEQEDSSGKELALPLGWKLLREHETMLFLTPDLRLQTVADFEYQLAVPGRIYIFELAGKLEASLIHNETPPIGTQPAEYNPQQLLRADLLTSPLIVRNWRAGDRFWPAHTKSPKKVKELLQELHLPQQERKLWPVVVNKEVKKDDGGEEIVWMRGFPVPARWLAKPGQDALWIRETSLPLREDDL
jgi:tRNA(Ile)-lysidine synthase